MKVTVFLATWLSINLLILGAWASEIDIDQQDIGSEAIKQPAKRAPFSFETHVDVVGGSKINKGCYEGEKIYFAEAEVDAGMVIYYCPAYTEGLRLGVSYTATYLRWNDNPWFDQHHFNTVSLNFAGFTQRFNRWFWRTQLSINFDASEWSAPYINYDIILWGRYAYSKCIGIHMGIFIETGMRLDRIYPIIGADWQMSRDWKLNLVFPLNVSLEYALSSHWSLALAGRNFNSRHRVNHRASYAQALVRYENIGAEFAIKYEEIGMSANIHVGSTLGGKYRVATRHNHHADNQKIDPAAYAGAEIDVKF